jgi:hypothetical protein
VYLCISLKSCIRIGKATGINTKRSMYDYRLNKRIWLRTQICYDFGATKRKKKKKITLIIMSVGNYSRLFVSTDYCQKDTKIIILQYKPQLIKTTLISNKTQCRLQLVHAPN